MNDKYILNGHAPVLCDDPIAWAKWYETADRHVAKDTRGGTDVSTVFLGLDCSFGDGPPVLFETLVFGGDHDQDAEKYYTWDEAEVGHQRMCEKVFAQAADEEVTP